MDDKVTTINLDVGSNLTLVAGSRVKVICEADGVPEPSITWQQDDEEVLSSWNKTSLTIDNPGQVNLRTVSCTANNVLGIDTKASYFTILGKKLLQFSSLNIIAKKLHARTFATFPWYRFISKEFSCKGQGLSQCGEIFRSGHSDEAW